MFWYVQATVYIEVVTSVTVWLPQPVLIWFCPCKTNWTDLGHLDGFLRDSNGSHTLFSVISLGRVTKSRVSGVLSEGKQNELFVG